MDDFVSKMMDTLEEETSERFTAYMIVIESIETIVEAGDEHAETCVNSECKVNSKLDDIRKAKEVLNGIVMAEMLSLAVDNPELMNALANDNAALANAVSQIAKEAGL